MHWRAVKKILSLHELVPAQTLGRSSYTRVQFRSYGVLIQGIEISLGTEEEIRFQYPGSSDKQETIPCNVAYELPKS